MSQPDAHVLAGQPVEQLGMARRLALGAEVFLGLDQADAEQLRPEPVDGDACGQRIVLGSTSHVASPRRSRGAPSGSGWKAAGTPGSTAGPGSRKFPLCIRCVTRRLSAGSSSMTGRVGIAGRDRSSAAISSRSGFSSGRESSDSGGRAPCAARRCVRPRAWRGPPAPRAARRPSGPRRGRW